MTYIVRAGSVALVVGLLACAAPESSRQDPEPVPPQIEERPAAAGDRSPHSDEGKIIERIAIMGCDSPEAVFDGLRTRVGQPLCAALIAEDIKLWWTQESRIVAEVFTRPAVIGNRIHVTFVLMQDPPAVPREGQGGFAWGAGVSTGDAATGRFQFTKQSFAER